jgi:hypothetical protein
MKRLAHTAPIAIMSLIWLLLPGVLPVARGQASSPAGEPEAYLRHEMRTSSSAPGFYVEVYMMNPLAPGQSARDIRASLRDTDKGRLLSASVVASPEGDSNFRMLIAEPEADIIKQMRNYVVFVDAYPTASGNLDKQVKVATDVSLRAEPNPSCIRPNLLFSITVKRETNFLYARQRIEVVREFLARPDSARLTAAKVSTGPTHSETRDISSITLLPMNSDTLGTKQIFACGTLAQSPPAGDYEFSLDFLPPAPFELRQQTLKIGLSGVSAPTTTGERNLEDFIDLGLTLTSSVDDVEQEDETTKRVRTTRGALDLWFAPILNLRKVKAIGEGGTVQVFTPFYIDAKVATGKITSETLALNRIILGSNYELRDFRNTNAYPDLLRHSFNFNNTSDRDFKQAEFKFVYEFQPIFGAINQPLGSAPDILDREVIENQNDKFGLEIVPVVGVELGRTYRVRNPQDFEGVSRNVRRFYFGANMTFDLTKHFRLSLLDRFYVRGETPEDRGRNYFTGSIEAPLSGIGNDRLRGAHALFFSFERGDQPPFSNPGVNVFKFGYRIRARGLLVR